MHLAKFDPVMRCHEFTVITFDEQLYCKAKMLQWYKDNCKYFIMLGGFHTQMNFAKVIGEYMDSCRLVDIWIQSEILGENTAGNVIKEKGWNRVIRAHKPTLEYLWAVLWIRFKDWAAENDKIMSHSDRGSWDSGTRFL